MVVAEVPLWMIHSKSDQPLVVDANKNGAGPRAGGGGDPASQPLPGGAGGAAPPPDARRASRAAALWHPSTKSPLYSVDCHSQFVCTGGGDGTARVWRLDDLFSGALLAAAAAGARARRAGRVDEGGGYASAGEEEGEDDDEEEPGGANGGTKGRERRAATAVSEASSEEEDGGGSDPSSSSSSSSSSPPPPGGRCARDLTPVARKKGTEPKQPGFEAAAAPPPPPPSPSREGRSRHRGRRHHNHHHRHAPVATLTGHSGSSVLAVRFSNRGRLVATGGDDGMVLVYRTTIGADSDADADDSEQPPGHSRGEDGGGDDEEDEERAVYWPRVHMGAGGHGLDVVDLAWSPDDSLLVSCSVDSNRPVVVWKLPAEEEGGGAPPGSSPPGSLHLAPYRALSPDHHLSTVRGVAFDPAGSYLATSGDDPAVCVWRAHDDWGLEKRITDIFYRTPSAAAASEAGLPTSRHPPPPPGYHRDPTFVRRLSWSTDGSYIACTNATVKNKHVAATVARGGGWATAGNDVGGDDEGTSPGAPRAAGPPGGATLVGHRQPVVACRHCPRLLRKEEPGQEKDGEDDGGDDDEQAPSYSTLLALGDKSGFVTVWTTRHSRPVFKVQCASRTTVTDLAWSTWRDRPALLVSQLDGAVTALLFQQDELPALLPRRLQSRVFALKYGMDEGSPSSAAHGWWRWSGGGGGGPGGSRRPGLIESALAMAQQDDDEEGDGDDDDGGDDHDMAGSLRDGDNDNDDRRTNPPAQQPNLTQEVAVTAGGKKRVRPVLVSAGAAPAPPPKPAQADAGAQAAKRRRSSDPLRDAVEAAERAAAATQLSQDDGTQAGSAGGSAAPASPPQHAASSLPEQVAPADAVLAPAVSAARATVTCAIPCSIRRIVTVDLPLLASSGDGSDEEDPLGEPPRPLSLLAECSNSTKVPGGGGGAASGEAGVPCADVVVRRNGAVTWRDLIAGTHASEVAAASTHLAVGTSDGVVYLYGTSPGVGWKSGHAFRSHPPLVVGYPVVSLRLQECAASADPPRDRVVEMLVVGGDGGLAVYELFPRLRLQFRTSVVPAMHHMALSCQRAGEALRMPELSRIQFTEPSSGRLLLLLGLGDVDDRKAGSSGASARSVAHASPPRHSSAASLQSIPSSGVGGSLQGFVYDRSLELWMRVADSRFVLSDFYSLLPSKTGRKKGEVLSRLEDAVRFGSIHSSWRPSSSRRGQQSRGLGGISASAMFDPTSDERQEDPVATMITRSHCEDRMACAVMLGSASEYKRWLGMYARTLAISGNADAIRLLADALLLGGEKYDTSDNNVDDSSGSAVAAPRSWWLSRSASILGLDRRSLVQSTVLPELRKNLALQRLANEISLELSA